MLITPVSKAIQIQRQRLGQSQHAAVRALNEHDGPQTIAQSSFCDWENGRRIPRKDHYKTLAQWLGISFESFAIMCSKARFQTYAHPGHGRVVTSALGAVLKELRSDAYSQVNLAPKLSSFVEQEIKPWGISRFERGLDEPGDDVLAAYASLFNTTTAAIQDATARLVSVKEQPASPPTLLDDKQQQLELPKQLSLQAPSKANGQNKTAPMMFTRAQMHQRLIEAFPPTAVPPELLSYWGHGIAYLVGLLPTS